MSQDIITDIALLMNHTQNMSGFTSDIEVVIRDVRIECDDASSCIISKKRDYEQHIDELNDTLKEIENNEHSRESEERKAEIKEKIRYYKKRINDMRKCQRIIEKIALQSGQIKRATEILSDNIKNSNRAFENVIDYFKKVK